MSARMWLRMTWLAVRRRVLPWCMRRGCWKRSVLLRGVRGNLCPSHAWEAIERFALSEDE